MLGHYDKAMESVLEQRVRRIAEVNEKQVGFMLGKGMQFLLCGKCRKVPRERNYYAFVNLVKAYDRVPRDATRWVLRKLGRGVVSVGDCGNV